MRSNPSIRISIYEIAGFVAFAYNRVLGMDIAVSGFCCTGTEIDRCNLMLVEAFYHITKCAICAARTSNKVSYSY